MHYVHDVTPRLCWVLEKTHETRVKCQQYPQGGCSMVATATLQRLGRRHELRDGPHVLQAVVFAGVVATHSGRTLHAAEPLSSHRTMRGA